jgi:hypothetical protein
MIEGDVLADGRFGRDDGHKCPDCGGESFLVHDDGGGLMAYECDNEKCGRSFQVQYDGDSF